MNKIKINEQVEEEIGVVSMLTLIKGRTAHEFVDEFVKLYKESDSINAFKSEETDFIMHILESMPGYTHEKFLTACTEINDINEDNKAKVFQKALYIAYIMLSITNPELFEDYEEEENNGQS